MGRFDIMKLFILLPCYNEEEALPCLLKSMYDMLMQRDIDYEIVVINDGSLDGTENAAHLWSDKLNIKVLNHEHNLGLGEAVNTGFSYFYENCGDVDAAVVMDADNTHNPEIIPLMLDKIKAGFDAVIASRYEDGGREIGLSFIRRFLSAGINLLLKLFFKIEGVRDYTCGYRAYSSRAVRNAFKVYGRNFIEEKGFTCMTEIIMKLFLIGSSISEVPLVLRYDLKGGRSKMKIMKTILRYFVLILGMLHLRRVLSREPVMADGKEK